KTYDQRVYRQDLLFFLLDVEFIYSLSHSSPMMHGRATNLVVSTHPSTKARNQPMKGSEKDNNK
ncbi:hypothetical protein ACV1JL_10700, partial [Streptococcus agalactiae]